MSINEVPSATSCDVLVVGGGPAGAWAALAARASGAARVTLVDKGYCGTSGATASANTGVWLADGEARKPAVESRLAQSGGLAHRSMMEAVLDTTAEQLRQLAAWGYPFPVDDSGLTYYPNLRGPDYMAFLRKQLRLSNVRIMDHSPALELLAGAEGISGVSGHRFHENAPYSVRARAVVLASGGVAFLSKTLGCDVNTGDGLLMAVEAGAELSGMEFSAQYGICPAYSSVTKGLPYFWATFTTEDGKVIDGEGSGRMLALGQALLEGPVYAVLDRATPEVQRWLRDGQPNCFLPHDRLGIDPFRERFPITLRSEGTVRGSGGIRVHGRDGSTRVRGLFAAGDAASRELLIGAASGGGAPNAAWAISSGSWSGHAAAQYAAQRGGDDDGTLRPLGTAGLRPSTSASDADPTPFVAAAQAEALPLDKNLFRSAAKLEKSLVALDGAWRDARAHLYAEGRSRVRAREAASLLASARFAYRSALARNESRCLHRRLDRPETDPAQRHYLASSGLDEIEVHAYQQPEPGGAA